MLLTDHNPNTTNPKQTIHKSSTTNPNPNPKPKPQNTKHQVLYKPATSQIPNTDEKWKDLAYTLPYKSKSKNLGLFNQMDST